MRKFNLAVILTTILSIFISSYCFACTGVNGIPDYNCDGKVQIFFVGDSLVFGTGDTANGNQGGYVLRLKKSLKKVSVKSYGVKGLRASSLLRIVADTYVSKDTTLYPQFRKNLAASDIIILDLGRNDRWLRGPELKTYRHLALTAQRIAKGVKLDTSYTPLIVQAVLMLPNRGDQGPWVQGLNKIILSKSTTKYPSDLRFDVVSKRLLNEDQLHPTPKGYTAIAKAFKEYIPTLKNYCETLRPDTDSDGISDIFETKKFLTDPNNPDSDLDGKNDGQEVFVTKTNPLVVD
jgi:lysophospholipase L1-like esterase